MSERTAYLIMLVSIPIVWQLAVLVSGFEPFMLPPPAMVWRVLVEEWDILLSHIGTTMKEALIGYAAANLLAIAISVSFLYISWFESFFTPWTVMVKNVPFVTIATMLIILFGGDSLLPKVLIVVLVTFFPIQANLTKGLKSTDPVLIDRMKVLNASRWMIFRKVRWPSALPYYVAAQEIAFTGSIIGAIIAEWLFARRGLGFVIVQGMTQYRADRVYAVTIIASLLAIGAYIAVKIVEKRIFHWQQATE